MASARASERSATIPIAAKSRARRDASLTNERPCSRTPRNVRISVRPAELAAQLGDVHVDRARAARVGHAPDPVEQLVPRDDDPGILEQVREQVELAAGELDGLARDGDLARLPVEHDVAELQGRGGGRRRIDAAQHGLDPRRELARRERLGDVVVGADLEPGDAVALLVARRQHQDRDVRAGANGAAHVEPVLAGQADVEDDHARLHALEASERILARPHPGDAVAALLEVGVDESADGFLVLDEQQLRPSRDGFRHLAVIRTSIAGASPSRITVATSPRRSSENGTGRPPRVIEAFGETAIVTSVPSRSRSVSDPGALARITPRSIR